MPGEGIHFKLFRGEAGPPGGPGSSRISDLWFSLSPVGWRSLVLVPADEGISAADVATSLAAFGGRLLDSPVTAIVADSMDFESARILSELLAHVHDGRPPPPAVVDAEVIEPSAPDARPRDADSPKRLAIERIDPRRSLQGGAVIVAIQPVVIEPLGVAIAQAASAVVMCVGLGKARLASARRTMDLIGPDRFVGAYVVG